jgi:tyrosine-protein phosphatase YwqE
MFSLFRKKNIPVLKVDIHSHLIANIDDGSKTIEESLFLLEGMQKLGYEKVITTPHIMLDSYKNTPTIINNGLNALIKASKDRGLTIQIEASAEYYLDEGFEDIIKNRKLLPIANQYILLETSYMSKPMQLEDTIFSITSLGYTPILAHPERYRYIKNLFVDYNRLKELGVLFQVDLNSLVGYYGKNAKDKSEFLSENGMIDFLGSDLHNEKQLKLLSKVFNSKAYLSIFDKNNILNNNFI